MALPKLVVPEYDIDLKSIDQPIKYRPFLVKEEKILLMALETQDQGAMADAMKRIIKNCVIDPTNLKVDQLPMFDVELLFLNIRARSVSDVIKLNMKHTEEENLECKGEQEVEINIDKIELEYPEDHTTKIMLTDDVGVEMRYPTFKSVGIMDKIVNNTDATYKLITSSIKLIFDEDATYERNTHTDKEFEDFVASLNTLQFQKLVTFFQEMPSLKHEVVWTCPLCKKSETTTVAGLQNFFLSA